ncbi:helix-turn-helix transcriptional regulator [Sandaracinobacter neustonicus]|uniref:Helix-turn-helix transcriptional regulator n=1 Tax=Sandaracinobacter neustonicus TaxID=1715348 RepID=A0A501XGL8_9SPHN|nr:MULTISPECIES: helix-turn-helix transcriptional regulator [Alphaproteobacteria]TPE59752.1 helix-turn-helix transcriptional regulator [Sandaracinobacter neustonicus]HBI20131.1 helix-turn-helix transcriptional regulator [Brevundimonas sp.]
MRVDLLSERERECLRLLLHPMRAKEIARALGLSVHTVHDHLKSARRKLDAGDSLSAAQILRAYEAGHSPQSVGITVSGWPDPVLPSHQGDTEVVAARTSVLPFSVKGRPWNDLSLRWRIVWPLLLLAALAAGAGVLISGIAAVSHFALLLNR